MAGTPAASQPTTPTRRAPKREHSGKHMNGPLYKQAESSVVLVRRAKRKGETPFKQFLRWLEDNQTGTPAPPCPV